MKKIILIGIILITMLVGTFNVYGESVSELKEKQDAIDKQVSENKNKLDEILKEKEGVEADIIKIDIALEEIKGELEKISNELLDVSGKLIVSRTELAKAQIERDIQERTLQERIKYMYEYGDVSYTKVILESNSFSDLLNRVEYVSRIIKYDQNIYYELKKIVEGIDIKILEIEEQKEDIKRLKADEIDKRDEIELQLANKKVLLSGLEESQNAQEDVIDELEENSADIELLIKAAEAEAAAKAAAAAAAGASSGTSNFVYTGGRLEWPVPGRTRISSDFGTRVHPISGLIKTHTGIDIPAPTGANIHAAESGTVITSSYVNGYGYTVIINHGNGISTLYGHNSKLLVSVGDTVSRGQVIAAAGSTGNSTGPHCHFEVRINGKYTSPWPYLK